MTQPPSSHDFRLGVHEEAIDRLTHAVEELTREMKDLKALQAQAVGAWRMAAFLGAGAGGALGLLWHRLFGDTTKVLP